MRRQLLEGMGSLAAALTLSLALMMGCDSPAPAPSADALEAPRGALIVDLDGQSAAHAVRLDAAHVRVDIKSAEGTAQFTAIFRADAGEKIAVEYTLFPLPDDEEASPEPESAAIELELQEVPALDGAVAGAVLIYAQLSRAVSGYYDNWGCDLLPRRFNWVASCGPKGRCCDVHDACYEKHGCKASSWRKPPWNKCQVRCNAPAVVCFSTKFPGPSECCARRNCGQPR